MTTLMQYAVVDASGRVQSLRETDDCPLEAGESVIALQTAIATWPQIADHKCLMCSPDGYLTAEDTRDIEAARAAKRAQINAAWAAADAGTFAYAGHAISADAASRGRIDAVTGCVLATGDLPAGWPGGWRDVDNQLAPITSTTDWGAFLGSMVAQGMANFAHAQQLKSTLDAATTLAEIDAVVW